MAITSLPGFKRTVLLSKVTGNDTETYFCSAANILGKAQAQAQLVVNGDCVLLNSIIMWFAAFTLNEQKIDSWRLQCEVFQNMSVQDPSPRMLP